ncbi:hypothetical protein [Timonella senegalensis]|uniref:hypothetical protein n=1 Tax=Timonella senegalensis TaxID=1465825 RepID=UPI00059309C1|nr:hypothetical protein [Timonella senegalensis]
MSDPLDVSAAIVPKSDQKNAEDFLTGPRTFQIEKVTKGSVEQPFNLHLVGEPGKPYRPSKSMLRMLAVGWGPDASQWAGRWLTLVLDPTVKYGGKEVGGIKVSHMSHIDGPFTRALTVTRGKKAPHTVEPLQVAAPAAPTVTAELVAACTDLDELRGMHGKASPDVQALIVARANALKGGSDG